MPEKSTFWSDIFAKLEAAAVEMNKASSSLHVTPIPMTIADTSHAFHQERIMKAKVANTVLGYTTETRGLVGDGFAEVEYDLAHVLKLEDVESYLAQANHKKVALFFKEGWDLIGENATTVSYINKRLRQIAAATNISTDMLLRATASDLIKLSNCFWLLIRDPAKSGGKAVNGMKPIAGIFIIPAETLIVKATNNGQIISVRQRMLDGRKKTYSKQNVIHYAFDRKNGFAIGTPRSWSVIEDIMALRRIEENIERLIYRDLFPIYQYRVGTPERPAGWNPDGVSEVDQAKIDIEYMPPEGIYVTPERHEIKVIGHEGRALRVEGYLKHFKQRVLAGLNLSSVDVGEGDTANRNTAETMSQSLVDEVKDMQSMFEDLFNLYVIRPLLEEASLKFDVMAPENTVRLRFREIDLATQLKIENHNADMFQKHGINHSEYRQRIGKLPADDTWWEDSYWKLIDEPKALISAVDEPYSAPAQALAKASNSAIEPGQVAKATAESEKREKAARTAKAAPAKKLDTNKDRPANQHGKKLEPVTRSSIIISDAINITTQVLAEHPEVFDIFKSARADAVRYINVPRSQEWLPKLLITAKEEFKLRLRKKLYGAYKDGYLEVGSMFYSPMAVTSFANVESYSFAYVNRIFNDILDRINPNMSANEVGAIFDSIEYRVRFLLRTEIARANNFGSLVAYKDRGDNTLQFHYSGASCIECVKMSKEIYSIQDLSLLTIPPHHPNCTCKLMRNKTQYG